MNHWQTNLRSGYGNDIEYRRSLLGSLNIADNDIDVDKIIVQKIDSLYEEIGSHFTDCLLSLKRSPSRAQYILLLGTSPRDVDLFVFLFAFDTFFYLSKCLDSIAEVGHIDTDAHASLLRICSN